MSKWLVLMLSLLMMGNAWGGASASPLEKANIDLHDKASLQRGAKWYMNYCMACHSLKYARYKGVAKDIGISDEKGVVYQSLVQDNLIFTGAKIGDLIKNALPIKDARQWFGIEPPDLSLVTRVRGSDWVYTYLNGFYRDDDRPWGSNNRLYPDVGMPNVLAQMQGEQMPVYRSKLIPYNGGTKEIQVIDHLQLIEDGAMTEHQFESMARDIVNFLTYVAEPVQLERRYLGGWVLLFLTVLAVLAYFLEKEYWKDVK